jgi:hypothetical protein
MTTESSISEQLRRRSVIPVESTIPPEMTIAEWRRRRLAHSVPCHHLHDTTTRYDAEAKQLSFLLICRMCGTESVVQTQRYEPRFIPRAAPRTGCRCGRPHEPGRAPKPAMREQSRNDHTNRGRPMATGTEVVLEPATREIADATADPPYLFDLGPKSRPPGRR